MFFKTHCVQRCLFCCMMLFVLFTNKAICRSLFLADYENGYDATYSAGESTAVTSSTLQEGDVKIVEGRFGKGIYFGRNIPAMAVAYRVQSNLEQGTIEFWFRPEWDSDFREEEGDEEFSRVPLFSSAGSLPVRPKPTCFSIEKNQYNWLWLQSTSSWNSRAMLQGNFWNKGEWQFIAASWDRSEGRLFLDGRLIAVSKQNEWQVSPVDQLMGVGSHGFNDNWGSYGIFDDFRISDIPKYVSSFCVPDKPLEVENIEKRAPAPVLSEDEQKTLTNRNTLFYADFTRSIDAVFAKGNPESFTNNKLEIKPSGNGKTGNAVRLSRTDKGAGTTLAYMRENNINTFLSTVEITLQGLKDLRLPAILFDATEIVCVESNPRNYRLRTGIRLFITKDSCLQWESMEEGKILSSVKSAPVILGTDTWQKVAFSITSSNIVLYFDGQKIAELKGAQLPSHYGKYFFIGSNSQAEDIFEGWLKSIEILLSN